MQNTKKGSNSPDGRENHPVDHVNGVDIREAFKNVLADFAL